MACCNETIVEFSGASSTVVTYTPELRAKHGQYPTVQVIYWHNDSMTFYISHDSSRVALIGNPINQIKVTHGGPAGGVIKIT